jgi:transcription elongation factor GreA
MPQKETLLTFEGLKKLEEEVEYLKTVKRKEIAERIKVAVGFGDLSENSEYDEAKNEQAQVEMRIADLENKLRNVKIIDEDEIETKTIQVGNIVQVLDIEFDEKVEYKIVGSTEADVTENKISNESPIGSALLGKKKNDVVDVETPGGMLQFKVLKITK